MPTSYASLAAADRSRLLRDVLATSPVVSHVLSRLLLSLQPAEDAEVSGKLLADHTIPDMAELIGFCFQRLLKVLMWQLGEWTDTSEVRAPCSCVWV